MGVVDTVTELVEPVVAASGAAIYDVTMVKNKLHIAVTKPDGVDLETLTNITRAVSKLLDDEDPVHAGYTLEVSSPGLERPLRTPVHYADAIGEIVSVKTKPNVEGERRCRGELVHADDDEFRLVLDEGDLAGTERTFSYSDVDRVRTVFEWGPTPKPNAPSQKKAAKKQSDDEPVHDERSDAQNKTTDDEVDDTSTAPSAEAPQSGSAPTNKAPADGDAGPESDPQPKSEVRSS